MMKKTKWMWMLLLAVLVLNLLSILFLPKESRAMVIISDILPIVTSLIAIICVWLPYRELVVKDSTKVTWLLLLLGCLFYSLAELVYGIMEIGFNSDMNEIFPGFADVLWCVGYIPFFWALFNVIHKFRKSELPIGKTWVYTLLIICFLILFSVISVVLLKPVITDPETSLLEKIFYLFYPISDVLVVAVALIVFYITSLFGKGAVTMPWRMLALGFVMFTIADLYYSYFSWIGTYESGDPIEILWNLGYLVIAIGGIYQYELIKTINKK